MRKYRSLKTSVITNSLFLYAPHVHQKRPLYAWHLLLSVTTSDVVISLIFFFFKDHWNMAKKSHGTSFFRSTLVITSFYFPQVFQGNSDPTSIRYHDLPFPVVTSIVDLLPQTWHNNVGLRMELYGCVPGIDRRAVSSSKARWT